MRGCRRRWPGATPSRADRGAGRGGARPPSAGQRRAARGLLARDRGARACDPRRRSPAPARARRLPRCATPIEAAGYRVIGMAWTNQVVQNLQRDGFDDATTIAAELKRLETGATRWDGAHGADRRRGGDAVDQASGAGDRPGAGGRRQTDPRRRRQAARQHRARRPVRRAQRDNTAAPSCTRSCGCPDAEQRRAFNLMHEGEFLPALAIFARQGAIHWTGRQDEAFDGARRAMGQGHRGRSGQEPASSLPTPMPTSTELNAALREECARSRARSAPITVLETADGRCRLCRRRPDPVHRHLARREERQAGIVNGACRHHPRDRGQPGHGRA